MEISEITDPIADSQSGPGLRVILLPDHTVEKELEACRVCLLMDCRLYSMQQCNLKDMFKQLTGLRLPNDKYLSSVCAECATFLVKCKRFREKSLTVQKWLNVLSNTTHSVTIEQIKQVTKLKKLSSNLSVKQSFNYYGPEIYVVGDYEKESLTDLQDQQINTVLTRDCEDNCVKLLSDPLAIQNPTNNFDRDVNVCEDYDKNDEEEGISNSEKDETIKTELTTGCDALYKREYMKLSSYYSPVKQNPRNNFDTDIYEEDITSINSINGEQIKTESEFDYENNLATREPMEAHSNLSVEQSLNYFGPELYVVGDYKEESPTDLQDQQTNTVLTRDFEDNSVKLFSDPLAKQNPTNNFDRDVNVCEDDEEEKISTSEKDETIKTELTTGCCDALSKREYMKISSNSPVKQNPRNNFDTDIYEEDITSIISINGEQIKTESEFDYENNLATREPMVAHSNLSVEQSLNYFGPELYVVGDYEEESATDLQDQQINTVLIRDCEDNSVNLFSDPLAKQNPTNNFDRDVNVCEDDEGEEISTSEKDETIKTELTTGCDALSKREYMKISSDSPVKQNPRNNFDTDIYEEDITSINIINDEQIKTELELENNLASREPMEAPSKLSAKENPPHLSDIPNITYTYEDYEENTITTLHDKMFSDSDEKNTDHEHAEVNVRELSEKKQTVELKKAGDKTKRTGAKKSVERPYNCELCEKGLKSKSVYLEHLRLEHHSSQHVCCICGLSFINKRCLRDHKKHKHVVDNSNIPDDGPRCPECSLQFLSEEALQTHLQGTLKVTRISVKHSDSEFDEDLNAEISDGDDFDIDGEEKDNANKASTKIIKKSLPTRKSKSRKVPLDRNTIILENMIVAKRLTAEEQIVGFNEVIQKRREHYQYQPYKCDICSYGTSFKKILETHMIKHSKAMGEFSCSLCHVRFKTNTAYYRHKRRHAFMYSCVECPFTTYMHHFASKHVFQFHMGKKYTCGICGKEYTNKNSYYSHKRIMHPSSQHVCSLCGYSFSSKNGVKSHHRAKHLLESTEVPTLADGPSCAECSLRFMNKKALKTHMKISHTTGTGKKMKNSCYTSTDSGNRKEVCETCGKLVKKCRLKYHLEEHAGKKYSCPICGQTYRSKIGMKSHKFYSHGKGKREGNKTLKKKPKRAQCTVCKKMYSSKRNLQKHTERTHSMNRLHCSHCEKDFSCAENLKQHVDHVHLKKPWPKKKTK